MDDDALQQELLTMMAEQRALMARTGGGEVGPTSPEVRRERREVFVRHADRLLELLRDGRWPTAERVGPDAARAAWLVAQHADTQVDVQRTAVQLLRSAVSDGTAAAVDLAMLEDRLAVDEGRRQRYGTQVADVVEGEPELWPCEDLEHLDERRASVGLLPLAEHLAQFR